MAADFNRVGRMSNLSHVFVAPSMTHFDPSEDRERDVPPISGRDGEHCSCGTGGDNVQFTVRGVAIRWKHERPKEE
jgi:hypothetical protein